MGSVLTLMGAGGPPTEAAAAESARQVIIYSPFDGGVYVSMNC